MVCSELSVDERPRVNEFYKLTAYKRPVSGDDRVFVVEKQGRILGAVRVEAKQGVQVLRGMYLHPDEVRKGLGTSLLQFIEPPLSNTRSYCIPLDHLTEFYSKIGFRVISHENAPLFLADRIAGYIKEGKKVVIMYRPEG